MNKERLEEAKKLIKHYHEQKRSNNVMLTERGVELIEHLYEQAERAQELKRANKQLERQAPGIELELLNMELTDALKQNKRYRVYLELIKTTGTYGKDISTGEILRTHEANLADEALEGEE